MVNQTEHSQAVPKWLLPYLDSHSLDKIETAVAEAEKTTEGEIVPMIIRRSCDGFSPTNFMVLIYAFVTLCAYETMHRNTWAQWSEIFYLMAFVLGLLLVLAFSRTSWAKNLFLNRRDLTTLVEQRAAVEFLGAGVGRTKGQTGILLLLSIEDRRAVVLGDAAIASKVSQTQWDEALGYLISGMKNKNLAEGMVQAIHLCGKILSENFPVQGHHNVDELSNRLIIYPLS
jgi:putative membrane protein